MKIRIILNFVVLLLINNNLQAQDSLKCFAALGNVFKIMQNSNSLLKSGFFIDYKTEVYLGSGNGLANGKDSAQLIMQYNKSALISNQKRIYHDDSTQVVILDDRKQIFISAMKILDKKHIPKLDFTGLQDSLLTSSHFLKCSLELSGKDSCYFAILDLTHNMKMKTGINRISYLINKSSGFLKKVDIDFIDGKTFKRSIITIVKINYNYNKEPFVGPACDIVMDHQGHLYEKYKLYKLLDLRKRDKNKNN